MVSIRLVVRSDEGGGHRKEDEVKREAEKARVGTMNLESDSALRRRETKRHGKLVNAVHP